MFPLTAVDRSDLVLHPVEVPGSAQQLQPGMVGEIEMNGGDRDQTLVDGGDIADAKTILGILWLDRLRRGGDL